MTLAGPADGPVTVDYATADGTASAGSDYASATGALRFEPGEQSKTISVDVIADTLVEGTEKFTVDLSNAQGAPLARAMGTGTIVDDDVAAQPAVEDPTTANPTTGNPTKAPEGPLPTEPGSGPPPAGFPPAAVVVPASSLALVAPTGQPPQSQPNNALVPPPAPPQPIVQPLTQAQTQAQQQAHHQAQQQAQQQAQSQAQSQSPAQAQAGMMSERQKETQAETAYVGSRDGSAQINMATQRRPFRPSTAPVLGFIAGLTAAGMALASGKGDKAPAPISQPVGSSSIRNTATATRPRRGGRTR